MGKAIDTTEIVGAIEIVIGAVMDVYYGPGSGNELIAAGIATMAEGALTYLSSRLNPTNTTALSGIFQGTTLTMPIVYGQVGRAGGVLFFSNSYGSNDQYLTLGIAHSLATSNGSGSIGIEDVGDVWVDQILVPSAYIDSGGNISQGPGGSPWNGLAGNLKVQRFTGSQTSSPTFLTANYPSAAWPSTGVGKGIALTIFELFMSTDQTTFDAAFPNGQVPNFLGVSLDGQKIYDPRLDSTNGGSGPQRLADKTTWAFASNPALILADYLTRARGDGGCAFSQNQVNWASVAAAANVCDTELTVPQYAATWNGSSWSATDSIPQYSFDGVLDTGTNVDENVQTLLNHMLGTLVVSNNQIYIYAGEDGTISGTLDESYLAAGGISYVPQVPRDQMYNAVKASYVEPDEGQYQTIQAKPIYNSTYETEDGGIRLFKQINLPGCISQYSAQTIEIILSHKSRNRQQITVNCNLKAATFACFDLIGVTIAELGLTNAPFRILHWTMNDNKTIDMLLQQETPGDYTVAQSEYQPYNPSGYLLFQTETTPPPAPTSLTGMALSSGNLLNFIPPSPASYSFISVFRDGSEIAQTRADSFLDSNTVAGSSHSYYVKAVNINSSSEDSAQSNTVSVTSIQAPDTGQLPNVIGTTASFTTSGVGWYEIALSDNAVSANYAAAFSVTVSEPQRGPSGNMIFQVSVDSTGTIATVTLLHSASGMGITQARVRADGSNHTAFDIYFNDATATQLNIAVAPITGGNGVAAKAGLSASAGTVASTLNLDPQGSGTSGGGTAIVGPGNLYVHNLPPKLLLAGNVLADGSAGAGLDAVSEGTTYNRVKATEITSGTVKQLNDGTTTRTAGDIGAAIKSGGNLVSTNKIDGRTETLATTVTHLNSSGQLDTADSIAADGATYGRVKGTALTNGEVDVSQAGVINKTLQYVTDDTTTTGRVAHTVGALANRPAAGTAGKLYLATDAGTNGITYRDTGSAWEVAGVGHLADINGTLDNVTQGSTYGTVLNTELASNTVKQLNDGTITRTASQVANVVNATADSNGNNLSGGSTSVMTDDSGLGNNAVLSNITLPGTLASLNIDGVAQPSLPTTSGTKHGWFSDSGGDTYEAPIFGNETNLFGANLPNTTLSASTGSGNAVQIGGTGYDIVIPNPGEDITLLAIAGGSLEISANTADVQIVYYLRYSIDGGSTWSTAANRHYYIATTASGTAWLSPMTNTWFLPLSPTGDVHLQLWAYRNAGTTGTAETVNAMLSAIMLGNSYGSLGGGTLSVSVPSTKTTSCTATSPATTCAASSSITMTPNGGDLPYTSYSWTRTGGTGDGGITSGSTALTCNVSGTETGTSGGSSYTDIYKGTVEDSASATANESCTLTSTYYLGYAPISATISPTNSGCGASSGTCTSTIGSATANGSGGDGTFTYDWGIIGNTGAVSSSSISSGSTSKTVNLSCTGNVSRPAGTGTVKVECVVGDSNSDPTYTATGAVSYTFTET